MPSTEKHIEMQPIVNSMPDISDQLSPQIVQEILKARGVNNQNSNIISDTKQYVQTLAQATKLSKV